MKLLCTIIFLLSYLPSAQSSYCFIKTPSDGTYYQVRLSEPGDKDGCQDPVLAPDMEQRIRLLEQKLSQLSSYPQNDGRTSTEHLSMRAEMLPDHDDLSNDLTQMGEQHLLKQVERQFTHLRHILNKTRAELSRTKRQLRHTEETVGKTRKTLTEVREKLQDEKKNGNSLQEEIQTLSSNLDHTRSELKEVTSKYLLSEKHLKQSRQKMQSISHSCESDITQLQDDLSSSRQETATVNKTLSKYMTQLQAHISSCSENQRKLSLNHEDVKQKMTADIEACHTSHSETRAKHTVTVTELKTDIALHRDSKKKLQQQYLKEKIKMQHSLGQCKTEKEKITEEKNAKILKCHKASKQCHSDKLDIERLHKETVTNMTDEIKTLEKEAVGLDRELNATTERCKLNIQECHRNMSQVKTETSAKISQLEKNLDSSKDQHGMLLLEHSELQEKHDQCSANFNRTKKVLVKYRQLSIRQQALSARLSSTTKRLEQCLSGHAFSFADFEGPDLGGFHHGSGDLVLPDSREPTLNWTLHAGETPTPNTGPSVDHTCKNHRGHYMFAEASQAKKGDIARLMSPEIIGDTHHCVVFYYHMLGHNQGTLNVYLHVNNKQEATAAFRVAGNQGDAWPMATIYVRKEDVKKGYRVIFDAVMSGFYAADIAIDDISIKESYCY